MLDSWGISEPHKYCFSQKLVDHLIVTITDFAKFIDLYWDYHYWVEGSKIKAKVCKNKSKLYRIALLLSKILGIGFTEPIVENLAIISYLLLVLL